MKAQARSWGLLVNAARAAWALVTLFPWNRAITLAMMVAWDTTDTNITSTPSATSTSHWAADRWADRPAVVFADRSVGSSANAPTPKITSWTRKASTGTIIRPGSSRAMVNPMPTNRRPRPMRPPDEVETTGCHPLG